MCGKVFVVMVLKPATRAFVTEYVAGGVRLLVLAIGAYLVFPSGVSAGTVPSDASDMRAAAFQGDPVARYRLGSRCAGGESGAPDYVEAYKWLTLSLVNCGPSNEIRGAVSEAIGELQARLTPREIGEARRRAAAFEASTGLLDMIRLADTQKHLPLDQKDFWVIDALGIINVSPETQNSIGALYCVGEGAPKDTTEAAAWFQKAAAQGNAEAQYNLGILYDAGEGVPRDATEAVRCFRAAAERGLAVAQCEMGDAFARGSQVPKDIVEAYAWYSRASAGPDVGRSAARLRDNLARLMDPAQMEEGRRRAFSVASPETVGEGREGGQSE